MKTLKQRIHEREMKQTGGTPERADFHSKSYHKYFEGYSEYTEINEKGKKKLKRIYTGVYHTQQLTTGKWWAVRIIYCACWLLSVSLYMFCVTRNVESNLVWYVAVMEAFSIIGIFWLLWSLYNYLSAGKNMTMGEYRYVEAVTKSSRFSFVAEALTAATTLFYALIHRHNVFAEELLCTLGLLIASMLCLTVFLIESKIPYDSFLSKNKAPLDANQITYDDD